MIDIKELMVGNYTFDKNGKLHIVTLDTFRLLNKCKIVEKGNGFKFNVKNDDLIILFPIPITEEWLLKFRFEKLNRIDFGELKPCYAMFSFALMIRHDSYFVDWIGGNTEIKYVHQLQNLYFTLTKKKLECQ